MSNLHVLHLAGSPLSDFFYKLSMIYAKEVVQPVGVDCYYAAISPGGFWQLGKCWDSMSEKMSLQDAIAQLPQIDVVIPHMFCPPGMTAYRAFFEDILKLPVVGSPAHCTALTMNKTHTRDIVSSFGVLVATAQQFRRGDALKMKPPFIVKANSLDNSLGLTLVREDGAIEKALEVGFEFDDTLLIEDYIPGRELRVGVIADEDGLRIPSIIEYLCSEENPIRTIQDKYEIQENGLPISPPKAPAVKSICPAELSPKLLGKVAQAAKQAHIALGCRDYSLFDFRVHEDTEVPYLLEAGLFWSFSKVSMISKMLLSDGQNLEEAAFALWSRTAKRKPVKSSC